MTKDATNRRSGMKMRGAPTPLTEEEAHRVAGAGEGDDQNTDCIVPGCGCRDVYDNCVCSGHTHATAIS